MQARRAGEGGSVSGEARAHKVGAGAADNDNAPAFTVTRAELASIVRAAVGEAMGQGMPLLVDKQQLARQLGCCASHVDHMRKRGMPSVKVGVAVRFEPERVLEWLRGQEGSDPCLDR